MPQHEYTHGHHESVLRSHSWRTVANSLNFAIPYLTKTATVLDIGCGPGTITLDIAQNYVTEGKVTGMEYVEGPLTICRKEAASRGLTNTEFVKGDIHSMDFPDNTFDVVIAHQVLQHVADPVQALREMRRVAKHFVAVRDADFDGFTWYPESAAMTEWKSLYQKVATANGGTPNFGRQLKSMALKAGMEKGKLTFSSSNWCYATDKEVDWWSSLWHDRTLKSDFAKTCLQNNITDQAGLDRAAEAWSQWGSNSDAWFSVLNGELVYKKG